MRRRKGKSWMRRRWRLVTMMAVLGLVGTAAMVVAAVVIKARDMGATFDAASYPAPESAIDVTPRYDALAADGRLDQRAVDAAFERVRGRLAGVRFVIVPSYLVDQLLTGREFGLVDYFSDHQAWIESIGIETVLAPIDTEASVATNGQAIAGYIAGSDAPLCLLSHSKGGLDTLDALLRLPPDARARIRCWIAIQAPFAGSPLADLAAEMGAVRRVADGALTALGGSPQSIDDMTTAVRGEILVVEDAAIRRITAQVPLLAVATRMHAPSNWLPDSHFEPSRHLMARHGIESDGAVPTGSAVLPHARFVVIDGLDHGDLVDDARARGGAAYDEILLLKALLAITLADERTSRLEPAPSTAAATNGGSSGPVQ